MPNIPGPSNLKAVAAPRQVTLSWTFPYKALATHLRLFQSDNLGNSWTPLPDLQDTVTQTTFLNLLPGRTYQYKIQAINAKTKASSVFSNVCSVSIPQERSAAPVKVLAGSITTNSVQLSWTDCSDNEDGFRVERSTNGGGTWTGCASTIPNLQTVAVGQLSPETTYLFRVVAFNTAGDSPSSPVSVTTLGNPPAHPLALTIDGVSATTVDLKWTDASSNESGFVIQSKRDFDRDWTEAGRTNRDIVCLKVTGLVPETRYLFQVQAVNVSGNSPFSNVAETTTLGLPPTAPDDLQIVPGSLSANSVDLVWRDNSSNEIEFQVFRSGGDGSSWDLVGRTSPGVNRYAATGLAPASSYQFKVNARNRYGTSADTAPVKVTTRFPRPNRPEKLRIENQTSRTLDLVWNDCSLDEDDFLIFCSINDGPFVVLTVVPRDTTRYTVNNLQPLTKYCFQVQARNQGGESDFTPAVCLQTKGVAPNPPSGFEVRNITATSATLAWRDNSDNETDFAVLVGSDGGKNDTFLTAFGANQTSGALTGLKPGTRYLLKIQARNSWGESPLAGPVEFWTSFVIPDVPQQLTAVPVAKDQVDLSWTLPDQVVDSFDVHYTVDGIEAWTVSLPYPPGSARRTSVTGLQAGTRYNFRARASNRAGDSAWSNIASATTWMIVPERPQDLVAGNATSTSIDLWWSDRSGNEAEFQVLLSSDKGVNWKVVGGSSANIPRFQVRGLKPDTEYQFQVKACNSAGCSDPTPSVTARTKLAPPAAPSGLKVENIQARQLDLVWTDCSNEAWFEIEQSFNAGVDFVHYGKAPANTTRETVKGLSPKTQYVFRVRAFNDGGFSPWSKPASGTTLGEVPAIPGKPVSLNTTARSIELQWADNSDNETKFRLEMSDNRGLLWIEKGTTLPNTPRLLVTGLSPVVEYWFRVLAENDAGKSLFSEILRETTRGEPPLPPSDLAANNITQTGVDLSWRDNSIDEQFYDVEISRDKRGTWQRFRTVDANVVKVPIAGLDPGTEYWFQVRGRNSCGSSPPAGPLQVITLGIPPARPVLKVDRYDSTTVDLTWTIPSSALTGFELSVSRDLGNNWTVVSRPRASESKAQVANLTPDADYLFRIEAFNDTVASGPSNQVSVRTKPVAPKAPSQLTVSDPSPTSLKLTWKDNSTNEVDFKIEMSDNQENGFAPFAVTQPNVVSFTAGSLAENRRYCFRVQARNSGGESEWSNVDCGTTLPKVPCAPIDLRVNSVSGISAVVTWKAGQPPFDGYQISWRPSGTTTWTNQKKLPASSTSETLTGLANDTLYDVTVSAFNVGVESKSNPEVTFVTLPAAPTGFITCNATATSLTLKWNDTNRNEQEYRLQLSSDEGKNWSPVEKLAVNSTSRLVEKLVADTPYRCRLVAVNASGESIPAETMGRTLVAVPAIPTNLKVVSTTPTTAELSWVSGGGAVTGFALFRSSDDQRDTWSSVVETLPSVTTYTDKDLKSQKKYWYRVQAIGSAGRSDFSEWVEAITTLARPNAPTGVCVVNPKPKSLDVKWTDSSDNEEAFSVLVSGDKINYREGARVGAGVNCATLTGLQAETEYFVKVRAVNKAGESVDSNVVTGKTARRAPDKPGGFRVIDKSQTTLTLAWNPIDTRATALQIDISQDPLKSWQFCQRPGRDSTSSVVGNLSSNQEYFFRLRGENEAGESDWSAVASGCTLPQPPASPSNFTATNIGNIKLTLSWTNRGTDARQNLIRISRDQGGTFEDLALLDFANSRYLVTGLKPNTPYQFELFAVNGGLFSAGIPRVSIRTDNTPPTSPSNMLALRPTSSTVDLTWNGASREEKYEIQVSINNGGWQDFNMNIPAETTSFRATGLRRQTLYRFRIRAVNSVSASNWAVSGQQRTS